MSFVSDQYFVFLFRNKEDATFQEDVKKKLEDLKKADKGCIEFPASLTSHQRYVIHEVKQIWNIWAWDIM